MINGSFNIKSTDIIKSERGLEPHGAVQKYIDNEVINKMSPYTPFLTGAMEKSATKGTVIGSGEIVYTSPYARFQYYGKLMLASNGSSWARKGETKQLTDIDLNYTKSEHPLSGAFWFERMKADKSQQILEGAQKIADRGGK